MLDFNTSDGNLMGYADFELGDYRFEAWQPGNDDAPRQFVLRIFNAEGTKVREETVTMDYPNIWGVDVADKARLEERTEEIIQEMGLE